MAIEDSLARLQSVVDEVVAEVKQAVTDIVGTPEAPAASPAPVEEAAPETAAPETTPAEPVAAAEGSNVAQQDIVPAPTTEPPTDTDEASESAEEATA